MDTAIARLGRALAPLRDRRSRASVSTLIVPAPSAGPALASWHGGRRVGVPGLPPHVTVLYPFIAPAAIDTEVEASLESLAAGVPRFSYALSRLGRFPGVLFISPEPTEPFVELTRAIHARWPQHPPYGGVHGEIAPHVTAALGDEPTGLADAIELMLPIQAVANELCLLSQDGARGEWVTRRAFALGSPEDASQR